VAKSRLDDDTVDRILAGLVDPVDAPPGYEAVVTLLAAAHGMPAALPRRVAGPARRAAGLRPRLSILAAAVVLCGASGAAYAAGLPAAASSTAHHVLGSLGVASRPRTHPASGSPHARRRALAARPRTPKASEVATGVKAPDSPGRGRRARRPSRRKGHGHGAAISSLARSTSGTAGAKGAKISAAASRGKSHAGAHGHNGPAASHGHGPAASHGHGDGPRSHRPR
jgi:hypothetical protein